MNKYKKPKEIFCPNIDEKNCFILSETQICINTIKGFVFTTKFEFFRLVILDTKSKKIRTHK